VKENAMNVGIQTPRWVYRGIVATVLVGPSFNALAGSALDATIPAISRHYGGGGPGVLLAQLVLVSPGLFIIIGSPLAGLLGRLLGLRSLMVGSLVIYVLAGIFPLTQPGFAPLIVSRLILGFVSAMVSTNAIARAADFPVVQRNKLIGLATAIGCILAISGIVMAGWLTARFGWQASFFVYLWPLPLLPALFAMPAKTIGEAPAGSKHGWSPFVAVAPIFLLAFLWSAVMFASPIEGPFMLTARGLEDPTIIGLIMGGAGVISAVISALYGWVAGRLRPDQQILLVFCLFTISATIISRAGHVPLTATGMILNGMASGLVGPSITSLLIRRLEASHVATAMGLFTSMMFASQLLDPFFFRAITAVQPVSPYFVVMAVCALGVLFSLLNTIRSTTFAGAHIQIKPSK